MPDLSGDYEVDLTGQISMPLDRRGQCGRTDHRRARQAADRQARRAISRKPGRQRRRQGLDPAQRHGRRRGQQGRDLPDQRPGDADAGDRAGRRQLAGSQCPPRRDFPDRSRASGRRRPSTWSASAGASARIRRSIPATSWSSTDRRSRPLQKQILNSLPDPLDLPAVLNYRPATDKRMGIVIAWPLKSPCSRRTERAVGQCVRGAANWRPIGTRAATTRAVRPRRACSGSSTSGAG